MAKSWFELFENESSQWPKNISDGVFNIKDEGRLSLIISDKQCEQGFKKAIVNFFVEYLYMNEKAHLKDFMDSLERAILIKMLGKFSGNQRNTAESLGLNHTTLNQKIKKHNIRFRKIPIST